MGPLRPSGSKPTQLVAEKAYLIIITLSPAALLLHATKRTHKAWKALGRTLPPHAKRRLRPVLAKNEHLFHQHH